MKTIFTIFMLISLAFAKKDAEEVLVTQDDASYSIAMFMLKDTPIKVYMSKEKHQACPCCKKGFGHRLVTVKKIKKNTMPEIKDWTQLDKVIEAIKAFQPKAAHMFPTYQNNIDANTSELVEILTNLKTKCHYSSSEAKKVKIEPTANGYIEALELVQEQEK